MTLDHRPDVVTRESAVVVRSMLAIFDASPVGLGYVDRDFRIVDINAVLASVNGGLADDQIGRLVADVVPSFWPQLAPIYRRVIDEEEAVTDVEVKVVMATDGDRGRHWLCSYYPVRTDDRVIGIGIVAMDITERTHLVGRSCCRIVAVDDKSLDRARRL